MADLRGASVLIVDDVEEQLHLLAAVLRRRGLVPRPVPNGQLALDAALLEPPDLVLLDVEMPGLSGLEVCRRFKEHPRLRDIPIIFLSSHTGTDDKVEALRAGGVDYLAKPIQDEELSERVKTHIQLRRVQAAMASRAQALEQEVASKAAAVAASRLEAAQLTAQLQSAVEVAGLGLWRLDLASGRVRASGRFRRIVGAGPAEPLDRLDHLLARLHPEDQGLLTAAREAATLARPGPLAPRSALLVRWLHPDGSEHWSDLSTEVSFDQGGHPEALMGAASDVTDRVREGARLRSLVRRLQAVREEERAQLATELHQEVGAALSRLQEELGVIAGRVEALPGSVEQDRLSDEVVAAALLARSMEGEVKRLALTLRPAALAGADLPTLLQASVDQFGGRAGVAAFLEAPPDFPPLPDDATTALLRIAEEALANVWRHAEASRVTLRLQVEDGAVTLVVEDDGVGLDPARAQAAEALGLLGMRERARALEGDVEVGPAAGHGTRVRAWLPWRPPVAARQGG